MKSQPAFRFVQFFQKLMTLLLASSSITAVFTIEAAAQQYPTRPIRMMIGFAPGGSTDVLFRILADEMSRNIGQPVIVENRPGASGAVAAGAVKSAPPDGYLLFGGAAVSFSPVLMRDNPIHLAKELTPISSAAFGDYFIYVSGNSNIRSVADLGAYAKNKNGTMRLGSPSILNTMLMSMVANRMGFQYENIPYKATDQTIAAVINGDVDVTVNAFPGFGPHLQSGKLRAIATFAPQRLEGAGDIRTLGEQGVNFTARFSNQVWGPPGMPRDIVTRLNASIALSARSPAAIEKVRAFSMVMGSSTPEELASTYENDLRTFSEAAKLIGFTPQ